MFFHLTLGNFSLVLPLATLAFLKKGTQIEALTCSYTLNQLVSSLTHILKNSSWCTHSVLTFTNLY